MSPLLYILFIDGLLQKLRDENLGVTLKNWANGKSTWVGALMYADDLALQAKSPGELQLMMDTVTQYARKWRFCINPKKTKVLCFMENKEQALKREANLLRTHVDVRWAAHRNCRFVCIASESL